MVWDVSNKVGPLGDVLRALCAGWVSSIKEANWLISKGMCVLLFNVFGCSLIKKWIGKGMSNIYYWEKLKFSKLVGQVKFSERKFEEMH